MKPKNAGEDIRLLAETAYENLKQDAHKQDADVMQAMTVLHLIQL